MVLISRGAPTKNLSVSWARNAKYLANPQNQCWIHIPGCFQLLNVIKRQLCLLNIYIHLCTREKKRESSSGRLARVTGIQTCTRFPSQSSSSNMAVLPLTDFDPVYFSTCTLQITYLDRDKYSTMGKRNAVVSIGEGWIIDKRINAQLVEWCSDSRNWI